MSTLSERLRAYCIDFDGSQMKDLASPLDGMTCGEVREAADELDRLTARVAEWQRLYRRALNEANGLTNYAEDRPELYSAEKRLARIEEDARAALESKHE